MCYEGHDHEGAAIKSNNEISTYDTCQVENWS